MKTIGFLLLMTCGVMASCKEIQPTEKAATITGRDYTYCGFCGGWIVSVDSTTYRASLPPSYEKENSQVWIRYELDESPSYKAGHWIKIKSIRTR